MSLMQEEIGNSVFLANHYPNTPIRAMFIRGSPSTTQTKTLWADTTTLWVNSPQITRKTTFGPPCLPGPSPPNTNNQCVGWSENHDFKSTFKAPCLLG